MPHAPARTEAQREGSMKGTMRQSLGLGVPPNLQSRSPLRAARSPGVLLGAPPVRGPGAGTPSGWLPGQSLGGWGGSPKARNSTFTKGQWVSHQAGPRSSRAFHYVSSCLPKPRGKEEHAGSG